MRSGRYRQSQNVDDRRSLEASFFLPAEGYVGMRELGGPLQQRVADAAQAAVDQHRGYRPGVGPENPHGWPYPAWPGRYPVQEPPSGLTTPDISQGLYSQPGLMEYLARLYGGRR